MPSTSCSDAHQPARCGEEETQLDRAERQSVRDEEHRLGAREVRVERIADHRHLVAEHRKEDGEIHAQDRADDDGSRHAHQKRECQAEQIAERPEPGEPDDQTGADHCEVGPHRVAAVRALLGRDRVDAERMSLDHVTNFSEL